MEMIGTDYLEASPGNRSNSRRIAWCAFWAGLVFAFLILAAGLFVYITSEPANRPDLAGIAAAAITAFGGIAGSSMAYTFFQTTQEKKDKKDEGTGN